MGALSRLGISSVLLLALLPGLHARAPSISVEVVLEGVGQGHGVGFCQRGARAMAEEGADFRTILQHYFPNTSLGLVDSLAAQSSGIER